MTDDAEELFHATVSIAQGAFVCQCLGVFAQKLRPCENESGQSSNCLEQGHLVKAIGVFSAPIIDAEKSDQTVSHAYGRNQYRLYVIGKDVRMQWQRHTLKDDTVVGFEFGKHRFASNVTL